jgi:hypothetical protein
VVYEKFQPLPREPETGAKDNPEISGSSETKKEEIPPTSPSNAELAGAYKQNKQGVTVGERISISRILGLLLLVTGICGAIYYYAFFDISIEVPAQTIMGQTFGGDRVANLSLMHERETGILWGFGTIIGGIGLIFWGNQTSKRKRECPFCGEKILLQAVLCRYCGKGLERAQSPTDCG